MMVPVLSKTTVSIFCEVSRDCAFLKRIPMLAPLPVPTTTAVGVARPIAQGQAITRTATVVIMAVLNDRDGSNTNHAQKVRSAIKRTTGTKTPEIWSASLCMAAFEFWASSTSLMIFECSVSFPTFVAVY